jgi:hypothetical protein
MSRLIPNFHKLANPTTDYHQALADMGLNFEVDKAQAMALLPGATHPVDVPGSRFTYRTDTGEVFGEVGHNYRVINLDSEHLTTIVDSVIAETGATITGGYEIDGGARVGVRLQLPQAETVHRAIGALMRSGIDIDTGHMGNVALMLSAYKEYLACMNGLTQRVEDEDRSFRVKHTRWCDLKLAELAVMARKATAKLVEYHAVSLAKFDEIAAITLRDDERDAIYQDFAGKGKTKLESLREIDASPLGSEEWRDLMGTGWHAYSVLTEYLTHSSTVRAPDASEAQRSALRQFANLEGQAADTARQKAWTLVESACEAKSAAVVSTL